MIHILFICFLPLSQLLHTYRDANIKTIHLNSIAYNSSETKNMERHSYNWAHYNSDRGPPEDQLNPNWLQQIPDDVLVSQLSIPGTHNSGTFDCKWYQFCYWSQCQSWNITGQLMAGIRLLDFRVNADTQDLYIGHGEQTFQSLQEMLIEVKNFLTKHNSQFIILSVQTNKGIEDKSYRILEILQQIQLKYITYNRIPQVGLLRGKIWLMEGYGFQSYYKSFPIYGEEGITDDIFGYKQNIYKVYIWTVRQKKEQVLRTAFRECDFYRLKINYLSGAYGVLPFWLARTNGGTNEQLALALKNNYKGCLGLTIMDFPGTGLIRQIIYSNKGKNYDLIDPKSGLNTEINIYVSILMTMIVYFVI